MSTLDTMTSLISSPWCDAQGKSLSVRPLPGLRSEVIKTLKRAYPGIMSPALEELLSRCCGLADTELGHIDFTGCCFPDEPCAVFKPCITIAIDDSARRWVAEVDSRGLPGPVWCVFREPEVAVYVSDDLAAFIATLRDHACRGQTLGWLEDLTTTARAVWSHRRALAMRPHHASHSDREIRSWLSSLPADAYVYDLRRPTGSRAWPYGVAGPSGRLYRCGRLPVFAASGSPTEGWRAGDPHTTSPIHPIAQHGAAIAMGAGLRNRTPRLNPLPLAPRPSIGSPRPSIRLSRPSARSPRAHIGCDKTAALEIRPCA